MNIVAMLLKLFFSGDLSDQGHFQAFVVSVLLVLATPVIAKAGLDPALVRDALTADVALTVAFFVSHGMIHFGSGAASAKSPVVSLTDLMAAGLAAQQNAKPALTAQEAVPPAPNAPK